MRRDKRYATRSVQPAQSGPSAKVSCTPPQARSLPVRPERGNRLPLPKTSQHSVNDESPDTDHSDDLLKPGRSRVRKNTSGNVDRPRQSIRLRKFGKVQENGNLEDNMLTSQPHSYIDCEGDGHGKWKQPVDLQSGSPLIKMECPEEITASVPENHICPKKALFTASGTDYISKGNVTSSRQIKVNAEGWQGHPCQAGSNGHLTNSGDGQVLSQLSLSMTGSVSASAETLYSNYSTRNLRCQEEDAVSKMGVTDRSVCKRNRPLSHVNQSEDSKPREKRGMVKMEKVACLPSSISHDAGSGLHDEQTENCIVVKTEIANEHHLGCERNPPRQSPVPLRNHTSSYKFHSLRTDSCNPGPTSHDLSSSCKLDQGRHSACNQQKSLENSLNTDKNFRDLGAHNEHPDIYTLENRKSRTFQKISRKSTSLNSVYRENTVTKSSLTEELYQTSSPPSPSSSSYIQSQNNKLFSSEALGLSPEVPCVKSSLQYEQSSVINQHHLASPPRKIQERHSWPLGSSSIKEEAGRNSGQHPYLNEVPSPPVFKNVSEALHRLPESPKVPLVCMKDVIVIDSSPGSEISSASYQSSSPEQSHTAKSLHPQRASSSTKTKTAQRLCFDHEKESITLASKTKNLKDNLVSLDKNSGSDTKKDNHNKTAAPKATSNTATSRAMEKAISVNNSDLILSRTDRIRSPSIRYKDDVLFFPLVFPSRSSQSATNRVSEAVERTSNSRQAQSELDDKAVQKKESTKVVEKVNCQSKKNTNSSSAAAASKQTKSLDRRRILRGSSVKSENVAIIKDAGSNESSQVTSVPANNEQSSSPSSKILSTNCESAPSSDSALLPPKSNKVLRSQSSSLKALVSSPPLSSPLPSASSSLQVPGSEQKCSTSGRTFLKDQADSIPEPKTESEPSPPNTNHIKVTTSNVKATITDVTCKSPSRADQSPVKKLVQKAVSKPQSGLRSCSSTSAVIKEPAPLSILSRPEKASSENKKLNAFVSDELDKYLAQEIGNYTISPQKISLSNNDGSPSSKKINCEENKKVVSKKLSLSPKKIFCDKSSTLSKNEQSDCNSAETTTVAYNTRSNSSLNNNMSPEKNDKQIGNSSVSLDMIQIIPKVEPDAVSLKISEKQTFTLCKTEPVPNPIPASSDCQNLRILRPRPEQLAARVNRPGSSYSNSSVLTGNSQSYEPDFDEVDGILFMSFPNVESLQAHIAVERKSNWESAPSHMSSISKVLNFNRWKERHKAMKLPRPAFDKSKNLRGLHMRMKMYYKLLRSEWHKIKQRNQHRSRYGFTKTNDFSKIKSWQARLNKNLESKRSSQKLHWRTQDRLTRSLKPDEIRQMGIVKKRRKNFIFTHRKGCKRGDEELENSCIPTDDPGQMVNERKKQNSPTSHNVVNNVKGPVSETNSDSECHNVVKSAHLLYQSDEINVIKKLGGCDPSDYAMRKRTRSQVELENLHRRSKNLAPIALDWLTHNMAQVAMTALHDDFKKKSPTAGRNVSSINSEGKHNTDTFIQVDSKMNMVKRSEASLPSLFESPKSAPVSSPAPNSAVRLCKTSDEELAKETARILLARQKLKAKDEKCNKPGCRYGCICHLCWISENFEDSSKMSAICTKTCDKEYCRLGCICDSNDNIKRENMCDEQTCSLECCRCSEHKSVTPECGKKKASLKQTPPTPSDVVTISPEKLPNNQEPESSPEVIIKSNGTDIVGSPSLKNDDYDTDKVTNKKSDVCAEKVKRQRKDRPASQPKRETAHRDVKNLDASSRKPFTTEGSEIFQAKKKRKFISVGFDGNSPKVNFTKVSQLQTKFSSAYMEDEKDNSKTGPPPNSIKRLCPLKDDCRQPLEQCYVNCSWFPANTFDNCVVEIDRLGSPQQMRQLGCMSVDCFPQSPKVRTPQQMEENNNNNNNSSSSSSVTNANNSNRHTDCIKCELVDLSPIKVKPSVEVMSPPVAEVSDSLSPQIKSNSISPPRLLGEVANSEKWSCPLVDLTDVSAEDPAESHCVDKDWQVKMICLKAKQDGCPSTQNMEEGYQLLEFISNCNWDSHSSDVICQVSLCCQPGKYPDPQKMAVGNFDVEILPKSDKAPNVPAQLQSEIFCCPYNIRVKVTDRTKGTGCGEKVEPLLDGCSYVGISSVRPIRNNNLLDIKSMPLTATLQDINYQCQEDNEQNPIPNEAKQNVVGEIEVLEIHPPLDSAKMPPRALVLDLSPENQKSLQADQVKIVTDLSTCDLPSEKLAKAGKQESDSVEEIGSQPSSENLAAATDLECKSKGSSSLFEEEEEEEEEMKTTADTPTNIRVSRQRSREKTAVVVRDWPLRSKLGKAIKQELPVADLEFKKSPVKSAKNSNPEDEDRNMGIQEPFENTIKEEDAKNISVNFTTKLRTRSDIRKNKSRTCDSPQHFLNDSIESKTSLTSNCSIQNLKPPDHELGSLKSLEKTPIMQSFRKILPAPSLNAGFFVTSSQPGVGSICLGHLQSCSLVHTDLNNFTSVPHSHATCSTYPNAYRVGSVPANQFLQLVPVPVPVPVPVSFSVAPDKSVVNTSVTIPVINSSCYSNSRTTTCNTSPSSSSNLKTDATCCSSCCSSLPVTPSKNGSCIAGTNSNSGCNMKFGNNGNKPVNGSPSSPVPQPGHILVSQGQNNAILVPYNTFMKNNANVDSQEHCTDKCLFADKLSPQKCVGLKEVKAVPTCVVPNTNNELQNCQDATSSIQTSVVASSKESVPQQQQQSSQDDDKVCTVSSQNSKPEEIEKKSCAIESQMKQEPVIDVETVNCSSLQSGLNFDFRLDPIDEDDFDEDDDLVEVNNFGQSGKERRNKYQLSVHKTRERERRCNIFNGINFLQEVLCENDHIQFISQRRVLDFATDHIKSLQLSEEKLIAEKSSLVKLNLQLWGQLSKVKEELILQNVTECEQNKILDELGLPFDMYMPQVMHSTKVEDDAGSPLKLLPVVDSCEASDVESKDHSDVENEMDVNLVSSSLPSQSPASSGPLNDVHSSNEDTILMSPVTSQQMQDLDDDDYVEMAEEQDSVFNFLSYSE